MTLLTRIADAASNGILLVEWQRTNAVLERIAAALERSCPPGPSDEAMAVEIDDVDTAEKVKDESEGLAEPDERPDAPTGKITDYFERIIAKGAGNPDPESEDHSDAS